MTLLVMLGIAMAAADGKSVVYHTDEKGSRIEAREALVEAIEGRKVFRCQQVEAKLSKSGKSYSLVLVKEKSHE